ncbi:hypothetical protein CC78DRAFT_488314 [Lojkania enalia]|uniref:Uncharacterized protein n=1 Tax=Lojkania enalia TaxID=147567 RepID=A0A9P4KIS7_9PLEO|nr:hypothetical protein CC78DRAFT_488314 [Didymosphaeria enalia]
MVRQRFELLPQDEEDALHNVSRLLHVEARPYQRVSGRLLKPDALNHRPIQLPSPPPDASAVDEEAAAQVSRQEHELNKTRVWHDDIMNEIGLLDYAILRMELTTNSNQAERERYAKEKDAITAKQQSVRDNIEELRGQLQEAKELLDIRKGYDEQTEKITNSKMLKTRIEQAAAHAKLDDEIAELQQEVQQSKNTWTERRMQFGRIEEEAKEMLRMIKDEKEEAERKEGMMKDGDDPEDGEGSTTRGEMSHVGTPRPDGGVTPLHISQVEDSATALKVPQDRLAPMSRASSVAATPRNEGDLEMTDSGLQSGDANAEVEDSDGMEEGEEEDDGPPPDDMDQS